MKALEKIFFRLSDREQNLLVFTLWLLLVILLYKMVIKEGINEYSTLKEADQNMTLYSKFIEQKPMIRKALEKQKLEQKNKSYDKKNLSNRASSLADQVFPQRDYRELDTIERDRYSQHRIKNNLRKGKLSPSGRVCQPHSKGKTLHVFE